MQGVQKKVELRLFADGVVVLRIPVIFFCGSVWIGESGCSSLGMFSFVGFFRFRTLMVQNKLSEVNVLQ